MEFEICDFTFVGATLYGWHILNSVHADLERKDRTAAGGILMNVVNSQQVTAELICC